MRNRNAGNIGAAPFENPYAATDVTGEIGQSASVEPGHPVSVAL